MHRNPDWRLSLILAGALVAASGALAQPQRDTYPASRHGGNYMHNFYFPPAPS